MARDELFGSIYERGSAIFRQGQLGDTMYIIQSGAVEISHEQGEADTVLAILEEGDSFGEMALLGEQRRSATATAIQRTRVLPLTRTSLLERVQKDPGVVIHLLKGQILRIQRANRRLAQAVAGDQLLRSALGRMTRDDSGVKQAPAHISIRELADLWDVEQESVRLEAGETVFGEGEHGEVMYIILAGSVEISQGAGPSKYVLSRLHPGDFFGEMAIITDRPRSATAAAIAPTQLMPVRSEDFSERIKARPELALLMLQVLSMRLRHLNAVLDNPKASMGAVCQSWRPLLKKAERVKVSLISLSTCAGCFATFLDQEVLGEVVEMAEVVYCPMLIDQDTILEADVALIDGVVRLKEDQEKLEEARKKSRLAVAWGTCAAFGGIPAEANRFELEELIEETYGRTTDAFAYYLSGMRGVDQTTYQEDETALLRKAFRVDEFVRVDYSVPGCPPRPGLLLQLLGELTGNEFEEARAIVCGQCGRRPTKTAPASLDAFTTEVDDSKCFHSLGAACLGFVTKGGCGAACPRHALPCWGCRGPGRSALKKMAEGSSFEDAVRRGLVRRCRLDEETIRQAIKRIRKQSHHLFNLDQGSISGLSRMR